MGRLLIALLPILLIAGCGGTVPADSSASADPVPDSKAVSPLTEPSNQQSKSTVHDRALTKQGEADSTRNLADDLKKGQAYGDFRKTVLIKGWLPLPDPQCRANVIGADQGFCKEKPELQVCKNCDAMPELSSCSADGYCGMRFRHANDDRVLEVTTYGMTEDWNVSGDQSRLNVMGWGFTKAPTR